MHEFSEPFQLREICGSFPGGYKHCQILATDVGEEIGPDGRCQKYGRWLKFRDPSSGRQGWAKQALGSFCERDKDALEYLLP